MKGGIFSYFIGFLCELNEITHVKLSAIISGGR